MPHWTDDLANISESVRQRLRNVARETNENMQVVLIRYATERLMYRLSISDYSDRLQTKTKALTGGGIPQAAGLGAERPSKNPNAGSVPASR